MIKELKPVGNTIKIALCALCFGAVLVASDYKDEQKHLGRLIPGEQLSILSDSGCSEITYCADGYTTTGKDRLGNGRDHVYTPKKLTLDQWVLASKSYDSDGYDQFGLSITGNRSDGQSIRYGHIYY